MKKKLNEHLAKIKFCSKINDLFAYWHWLEFMKYWSLLIPLNVETLIYQILTLCKALNYTINDEKDREKRVQSIFQKL